MSRLAELLIAALVPLVVGLFSAPLDLVTDEGQQASETSSVQETAGADEADDHSAG